jgi:hypothetical protein
VLNASRKSNKKKKAIRVYSDSEKDSSDEGSQSTSRSERNEDRHSLYNLFKNMTCGPEYSDALTTLKTMLKKSDLLEVKRGDKGQRKNVRFVDYFPEKYTGTPKKLKRYLQRLLQYSAQSTTDDETRADVVADGPGLNEKSIVQLEQASRSLYQDSRTTMERMISPRRTAY